MELVGHQLNDLFAEKDPGMVGQSLHQSHRLNERGSYERLDTVVDFVGGAVEKEGGVGAEEDDGAVEDLCKDAPRRPHCHHCIHLWPVLDQLLHLGRANGVQGHIDGVPGERLVEKLPEAWIKQARPLHHHLAQLHHPCIYIRWQKNLREVLVLDPHRGEDDGGDLVAVHQELLHDGSEEDEVTLGPEVVKDEDMVAVDQVDRSSSQLEFQYCPFIFVYYCLFIS